MFFIDTNIFVYAHDNTDLEKAKIARQLLKDLSVSKEGCISTQVVQEFCNVALKKSLTPLKAEDIRKIIRELLIPLLAHKPDGSFFLRTLETYERFSLSFYDSAIVQAAMDLNCHVIYSEDMQSGGKYGSVKVVNPFI